MVYDTVDGSEILHHQQCINPSNWDKLPTSTGECRISEPSTVCGIHCFVRILEIREYIELFQEIETSH